MRVVEPGHLASVAARASKQLAADVRRDSEMIDLLQTLPTAYAAQRPLERLHPVAARDLQANLVSLKQYLQEFAAARRLQVSNWPGLTRPTLGDAVRELKARTVASGQHGIRQAAFVAHEIGGTAAEAGRTVARRADKLGRDASAKSDVFGHGRLRRPDDKADGIE